MVLFTLALGLGCFGCGWHDRERESDDTANTTGVVKEEVVDRPFEHSTVADTAGMDADLRIIEAKLGPLSPGIREHLAVVEVTYFSFADSMMTIVDKVNLHSGVLVVHACVVNDVKAIFEILRRDTFPIAKVIPINRYGFNSDSTGWNDAASMADNNTSAFNYRTKPTSSDPSKHGQGIAIDINPVFNPMVRREVDGTTVEPPQGRYDPNRPGTFTRAITDEYLRPLGWSWGGRWPKPTDHQHIEKSRGRCEHMQFSLK